MKRACTFDKQGIQVLVLVMVCTGLICKRVEHLKGIKCYEYELIQH